MTSASQWKGALCNGDTAIGDRFLWRNCAKFDAVTVFVAMVDRTHEHEHPWTPGSTVQQNESSICQ